jgi:hypothetical protein
MPLTKKGLVIATLAFAALSVALAHPSPPILPDPKLTPGDVLPVTKDDICVPGYTK